MKVTNVCVSTAAVAVAFLSAVASGAASTRHGPDLTVVSLSRPPAQVVAHSTFVEHFGVANLGDGRAPSSKTSFYLSRVPRRGRSAVRLLGTARVRSLKPGRLSKVAVWLTVPASAPAGSYFLIACADGRGKVKERNRHDDCRAAVRRTTVRSAIGSGGPSGPTGGGGSGGSGTPAPACIPTRRPTLSSANASCFDGDAAHGIFVSAVGDDQNPGTMAAPKRTLAAGLTRALALKGHDLYVTEGVYPEVLTVLDGVSVYGGYDVSWQRSPSNFTKITGSGSHFYIDAAEAFGITAPTTIQLLTLVASSPIGSGGTAYGLRGSDSPGLVLDHVTIRAGAGTDGAAGKDGANGGNGGDGKSGPTLESNGFVGGAGGVSPGGHPGGDGGLGGFDGEHGWDGAAGQSTTPDPFGGMGGAGGSGGVGGSNPGSGSHGLAGDSGRSGADGRGGDAGNAAPASGFWFTLSGQDGQSGTAGHGGGGGGGGGSDSCLLGSDAQGGPGGGGGGGGAGGGGGQGGEGGGGSFGIFLVNSTGARIRDSFVTASNGGNGGIGGQGGYLGIGGLGGAGTPGVHGSGLCTAGDAPGADGGAGGPGGLGGDGGGGAGGPSIGIYGVGATDAPGTTVSYGHGGAGAPGHGGGGAQGLAAAYL